MLGRGHGLLRVRCIGHAPGFLERLRRRTAERASRCVTVFGGQLALAEQIRLVLADVLRSELVRRAVKVARKILDRFGCSSVW